jgi:hypothetical protein
MYYKSNSIFGITTLRQHSTKTEDGIYVCMYMHEVFEETLMTAFIFA